MFVLNRPARMIGAGIGFAKEYNADRQAQKATSESHEQNVGESDENYDHEWAQAIDEAQLESLLQAVSDSLANFFQRHPPPPNLTQQPVGRLSLPVILPQRRPHSRTRGWVRDYAPSLADAGVGQAAWFEFLDQFEESIEKNNLFWASNAAVWIADKACIASTGNMWIEPLVLAVHLSIEASRRGYLHNKQNKLLDEMNEHYFKPRGLYALIIKYNPDDLSELGGWIYVRLNVTKLIIQRDDPSRTGWGNIKEGSADTVARDEQMPEFAPLIFPFFNDKDERQSESAFKNFQAFRQEYADRGASVQLQAQNPDSRLGGVAPQKEYTSRFSNPNHPARQGVIGLVTGGKSNPSKGII